MQLRRLGSGAINLFDYAELCEEAKQRDAEEGLRLFHVAATRARERLILSGVVKPEAGRETKPSTPVVERLVEALGVERDADADVAVPPPEPRPGLDATFGPSEIAVRVNLPSPERAAELRATRRDATADRPLGDGPAAAGRAPPPGRPQPSPLLHRDLRLRRVPLPLLHGAGTRSRRARSSFHPHTGANDDRVAERRRGGRDDALGARGADRAGGRRARAARVEPGERVERAVGGAGATPRARRRARPGRGPMPRRCWRPCAAGSAPSCASGSLRRGTGAGRGADPARGRRHRPARLDRPPGRARGRAAAGRSTTRPTASTGRPRGARRPLRDPAHDLRPGRRRVARRRRGRGRLRLPRAPGGAGRSRSWARRRWRPAASVSPPPSPASATASSRSPRSKTATGPSAAAAPPWDASARALRKARLKSRASPPARRAAAPSGPHRPRPARPRSR